MTKPVKDEIFGSRNSVLAKQLNVRIYNNLFFITCLKKINPHPESRYIVLRECFTTAEYNDDNLKSLLPFLNKNIKVGNVLFNDNKFQVKNIRKNTSRIFYTREDFAKYLLGILNCSKGTLQKSSAKIIDSSSVSQLSRFLRQEMFARAGSTDIDFIIYHPTLEALTIIEEKHFITTKGGSIGQGQYLSLLELLREGLAKERQSKIRFYLVFVPDTKLNDCYVYDFMTETLRDPRNPAYYDQQRKEQRIVIPFHEMEKVSVGAFLGKSVFV